MEGLIKLQFDEILWITGLISWKKKKLNFVILITQ